MKLIWTAAYLGALLSVAGIYDQVTKRIPSRLRADQVPESKFGIDRADNFGSRGRTYGVDIIFVHGLGSNPDTTWGPRRHRNRDTTAAQMTSDSRGKACWTFEIFFYNYDSYWRRDAVRTRLWNTGKSLLDRVATEIRRTEEVNMSIIKLAYGGLVIKRALIQASTSQSFADIAEHTRAVFFLGTPHRGSNPLLIQEVAYDSKSLLDLHREFVGSIWFIQWEEFCMQEQSATYDGANIENIELPVDHYGLNKFESKNENYSIILQKLLEIVTPIASQRQQGVYSVPIRTVESYTERHKLSLEVAEKLHIHHEKSSVPHALAIHGLGGTGKTQLTLKYIEDHKDKYNVIIWIDAKDEQSVLSSKL
ncbi:MAG: hypothetical protein M1840_002463 [Geoglossum simile]|nr:MAG: hypothetical protein M1840_002463 [Geoglossum simile]